MKRLFLLSMLASTLAGSGSADAIDTRSDDDVSRKLSATYTTNTYTGSPYKRYAQQAAPLTPAAEATLELTPVRVDAIHANHEFLWMQHGGRITASVGVTHLPFGVSHVRDMYVDPALPFGDARDALLTEAVKRCRDRDAIKLVIDYVPEFKAVVDHIEAQHCRFSRMTRKGEDMKLEFYPDLYVQDESEKPARLK
ncbi:MAG: hypothetical protein GC159_01985 [Phycisphaera sp.]|nr:hypothetical protein [Phycisphaera sp.]